MHQLEILSLLLHEHMSYSTPTYDLSVRGSNALGSFLAHFYANNGMGFYTFKTYKVCIVKVCDYSAGVWGYGTQTLWCPWHTVGVLPRST